MKKEYPIRNFFKFSSRELLEGLKTNLDIKFEDGIVVPMTSREIILQRYILDLWEVIQDIPIISSYAVTNYLTNGLYNSKTINKCLEVIFKDIVATQVKPNSDNRDILQRVWDKMYYIVSDIYNDILSGCTQYVDTINIVDLLQIQLDKRLLDSIREADTKKTPEAINNTYDVLDDILTNDPKYRENTVTLGYLSGSINANQVKQVLGSRGYITDIDGAIYKYPVASSFTLGMPDLYSLAIESRSAPKALTANNIAVPTSEYFSRELQLLTMYMEKLVDGDCGTKNYTDWSVRGDIGGKSDIDNLVGKRYLNEETGKEEVITKKHKHLEGKIIKLRTAFNCCLPNKRHICTACFGDLSYVIPKHSNIGHICAAVIGQAITQNILKTKHHTGTALGAGLIMDDSTAKVFDVKNKLNIFLRPELFKQGNSIKIIIDQYMAYGIKDIATGMDIYKINPNRISRISTFLVEIVDAKGKVDVVPVNVRDGNKFGIFTYEFMEHVIKHGYTLDNDDRYVIDVTKFGPKLPMIMLPEIEYNLLHLVTNLRNKLRSLKTKKKTAERETPESLLQELFDILNSKLNINIAHLEVVINAFCIKSLIHQDYDIARNSPERCLTSNIDIVSHRSLGNGFGWEKIIRLILNPEVFHGKNNISHPLDVLIRPLEVLSNEDMYR